MESTDEVYFDRVSQIRMDTWSQGRVGLVGDAAFCPSLLAGQGAALAMTAAYVLAGELGANGRRADTRSRVERYEQSAPTLHCEANKSPRWILPGSTSRRRRDLGLFFPQSDQPRCSAFPLSQSLRWGRVYLDQIIYLTILAHDLFGPYVWLYSRLDRGARRIPSGCCRIIPDPLKSTSNEIRSRGNWGRFAIMRSPLNQSFNDIIG